MIKTLADKYYRWRTYSSLLRTLRSTLDTRGGSTSETAYEMITNHIKHHKVDPTQILLQPSGKQLQFISNHWVPGKGWVVWVLFDGSLLWLNHAQHRTVILELFRIAT